MLKVIKVFLMVQGIINCILAVLCILAAIIVGMLGGPILGLVIPAIMCFISFVLNMIVAPKIN